LLFQRFCIVALWFVLGVTNSFPLVALRFFQIETLQASPYLQAMVGVVASFMWNLKMVVAFTSDCFPILGYRSSDDFSPFDLLRLILPTSNLSRLANICSLLRRKPYLCCGLALYCSAFLMLGALPPSLSTSTVMLGLSTFGQMTMGVMCDTLIVENMRHETKQSRGSLQTWCWVMLTIGGVLGTLGGGFVVQFGLSAQRLFSINAALKLAIIPFIFLLTETRIVGPQVQTNCSFCSRFFHLFCPFSGLSIPFFSLFSALSALSAFLRFPKLFPQLIFRK
jgi:hypothetical protein